MLAEEREEHKRILAAEREEYNLLEEERVTEENGLGFPIKQPSTPLEFPKL